MAGFSLQRLATGLHVALYRWTGGKIGGYGMGTRMLLLTTIGRKSGRSITKPLAYLSDGQRFVVMASNNGSERNPLWYLNLRAKPEVKIQVGPRQMAATGTVADSIEATRLWPWIETTYPQFKGYRRKTTREIPLVLLTPT